MQNDYIYCPLDSLIKNHNWQDSIHTSTTIIENNSHVADSTIIGIDLNSIIIWLFVYVVIMMMLLLFAPNEKVIHRKD